MLQQHADGLHSPADRKRAARDTTLKAEQASVRGCVYYERCPLRFEKCGQAPPPDACSGYSVDPIVLALEKVYLAGNGLDTLTNSVPKVANLVKCINETKGYNVNYWSIGNESSLFATCVGINGYDTVRFNTERRPLAEAMRAFDPTIKLIEPDTNSFTANLTTNVQFD